jgi:hypothetical protein
MIAFSGNLYEITQPDSDGRELVFAESREQLGEWLDLCAKHHDAGWSPKIAVVTDMTSIMDLTDGARLHRDLPSHVNKVHDKPRKDA